MFFLFSLVAGPVRSDLSMPQAAYDRIGLLMIVLTGAMFQYGNLD